LKTWLAKKGPSLSRRRARRAEGNPAPALLGGAAGPDFAALAAVGGVAGDEAAGAGAQMVEILGAMGKAVVTTGNGMIRKPTM
jgi:hypothetical protein